MNVLLYWLESEHVLGFLTTLIIFFITLFLVIKRWIGFWTTVILLIFSLAAGLLIDQQFFEKFFETPIPQEKPDSSKEDFQNQLLHAVENLKLEVSAEKQNLHKVIEQVQDIFDSVEVQKQKLQNFIEETREKFTSLPSSSLTDLEKSERLEAGKFE